MVAKGKRDKPLQSSPAPWAPGALSKQQQEQQDPEWTPWSGRAVSLGGFVGLGMVGPVAAQQLAGTALLQVGTRTNSATSMCC